MSGRAKLSRIIHVKPCQTSDEMNKENIDTPPPPPPPRSSSRSPSSPSKSSLINSLEDVFEDSLQPLKPPSSNHRRSRSLDRLPASGKSSSGRRNSYFDVTHHTHSQSLGSPELPPVFTTTYNTIFSTITAGNNTNKSVCMNGSKRNCTNNNNVGKKNLNILSDKFKTAEVTFQKSPVRRRANW